MHDAPETAALKARAAAGDRWYDGPDSIEPGGIDITVALALFGDDSLTAYDVSFTWDGDNDFASFVLGVADSKAQAPGSYSPILGWIAWNSDSIVFAYQWPEFAQQGARVTEIAIDWTESSAVGSALPWALMARQLVEVTLGDR